MGENETHFFQRDAVQDRFQAHTRHGTMISTSLHGCIRSLVRKYSLRYELSHRVKYSNVIGDGFELSRDNVGLNIEEGRREEFVSQGTVEIEMRVSTSMNRFSYGEG